ncbi:MAG: hypothetical protein IPP79_21360 [Chitinophagaceae bacterium]|nr:hypothetical protein [Chitinophagaceae bacterium]
MLIAFDFLIMASENHLRAFVRRLRCKASLHEPIIFQKKLLIK